MIEYNVHAVGKAIKRIRKEKGLSQEVLSSFSGLARSHLSMIESGTKNANFETLWRLANALDMAPHELVQKIEEAAIEEAEKNARS